jgi:hypothetical protein
MLCLRAGSPTLSLLNSRAEGVCLTARRTSRSGSRCRRELRQVVSSLGHASVMTYIQSGNVLFTPWPAGGAAPGRTGTAALAARQITQLPANPRVLTGLCARAPCIPRGRRNEIKQAPTSTSRDQASTRAMATPGQRHERILLEIAHDMRQMSVFSRHDDDAYLYKLIYRSTHETRGGRAARKYLAVGSRSRSASPAPPENDVRCRVHCVRAVIGSLGRQVVSRPVLAGRQAHASGGWVPLVRPGRRSASDFTIRSTCRRISALNGPTSIQ